MESRVLVSSSGQLENRNSHGARERAWGWMEGGEGIRWTPTAVGQPEGQGQRGQKQVEVGTEGMGVEGDLAWDQWAHSTSCRQCLVEFTRETVWVCEPVSPQ